MKYYVTATLFLPFLLSSCGKSGNFLKIEPLDWIVVSEEEPTRFVRQESGKEFRPWGVNYDHDESDSGRLLEDYWETEWDRVVQDFREIQLLGANVVRIHLQLGRFMETPDTVRTSAIEHLRKLVSLAEKTGLYLDLTGLGCYHKKDIPPWYDELNEVDRWAVQARFWEAIAETCRDSPAIFCYDLMNEPILPGKNKVETEWLGGELSGKFFVQRISLDLAGRTREQVAKAWVDTLTAAIRKHDDRHLITVGVIPWVFVFGGGKPFFHSPEVGENLDFVAVHFYPKKGEVEKALEGLKAYNIGKPVVVEETFPLKCSIDEMEKFIGTASREELAQGWISFYWGKTPAEYAAEQDDFASAVKAAWLARFEKIGKR